MSDITKISWTGATWNPILGCSRCSPGCANCYAISHVNRMAKNTKAAIQKANAGLVVLQSNGNLDWDESVRLIESRLVKPLRRRKAELYFVNSLSDIFHEDLALSDIQRVFEVMRKARQHRFQCLTKRSQRLLELNDQIDWPTNVWMGVSVESAKYASRIDDLRRTSANIKWISAEPLLGPLPGLNLSGIRWAVIGGESGTLKGGKTGPGARPMDLAWARDLIAECKKQGVPAFVKQLGRRWAVQYSRKDRRHGGEISEFPPDLRIREFPDAEWIREYFVQRKARGPRGGKEVSVSPCRAVPEQTNHCQRHS